MQKRRKTIQDIIPRKKAVFPVKEESIKEEQSEGNEKERREPKRRWQRAQKFFSSLRQRKAKKAGKNVLEDDLLREIEEGIQEEKGKKFFPPRRRKRLGWLAAIISLIVLFFWSLNAFSSVELKITPRQKRVEIDQIFEGIKSASKEGKVRYEVMEMSYRRSYSAKSSGLKKISRKASGVVVIYNAFSSSPQGLVARTRLETPDGKIYRLPKSVVVPGAKVQNGKIIPSSIEVRVYADKPGEEYNIGLSDFTIPGFKGTARYEKFYARSKTKMAGGFEGVVSVVSKEDIAKARKRLEAEIKNYLLAKIAKQVPKGYLLYDKAVKLAYQEAENNPQAGKELDSFTYSLEGTATAYLIHKEDLSRLLAEKEIGESAVGKVRVENLSSLDFSLVEAGSENSKIKFSLKGPALFVWKIDIDSLIKDLQNSSYDDYGSVFARHKNIERSEIVFKPKWWRRIPSDRDRIHIKEIISAAY